MIVVKITCKDDSVRILKCSNDVLFDNQGKILTQNELNNKLVKTANYLEPHNKSITISLI
jgi:hypothetical protein